MAEAGDRPAFYSLGPGGWRDYWSLLHPPYTAWHLSYVVLGACIAPVVDLRVVRISAGPTPEVPARTLVAGDGAVASVSVMEGEPTRRVHLAFAAPDRATVAAFHRLGTSAGFVSLGEPGERPQYHQGYYGAYLRDPDGHNVEAVFHDRP